jgi:hypothetical protein
MDGQSISILLMWNRSDIVSTKSLGVKQAHPPVRSPALSLQGLSGATFEGTLALCICIQLQDIPLWHTLRSLHNRAITLRPRDFPFPTTSRPTYLHPGAITCWLLCPDSNRLLLEELGRYSVVPFSWFVRWIVGEWLKGWI